MSYETTLATAAANLAADRWAEHRRMCVPCSTASRSRAWSLLCPPGAGLRREQQETAADLAMSKQLDRAPIDGQGGLF